MKQTRQKENDLVPFNPNVSSVACILLFKMLGQVGKRNTLSPFQQKVYNREI